MCIPLGSIEHLIIICIIVGAIFAILGVCLPYASPYFPANLIQMLVRVCWIIFKAIILILVVIIIFAMLSCLVGYAHF